MLVKGTTDISKIADANPNAINSLHLQSHIFGIIGPGNGYCYYLQNFVIIIVTSFCLYVKDQLILLPEIKVCAQWTCR